VKPKRYRRDNEEMREQIQ